MTPYLIMFSFLVFFIGAVFGKWLTNFYHYNHGHFIKGYDYKHNITGDAR